MSDKFIVLIHVPSDEIVGWIDMSGKRKIDIDVTIMELLITSKLGDDYMYMFFCGSRKESACGQPDTTESGKQT